MKIFKEFLLDPKTIAEQTIYMSPTAEVVNVLMTDYGLVLLTLSSFSSYDIGISKIRTFKICAKDEIFAANTVKYIGSFKDAFGYKHVIEILKDIK